MNGQFSIAPERLRRDAALGRRVVEFSSCCRQGLEGVAVAAELGELPRTRQALTEYRQAFEVVTGRLDAGLHRLAEALVRAAVGYAEVDDDLARVFR